MVLNSLSRQRPDRRSPEALAYRKLYKTSLWQATRLAQLQRKPLCEWCEAKGLIVVATVAHHTEPHRGDRARFFDQANLTSLCAQCHDIDAQSIEVRGYSKAIGEDGWPTDPMHPANQ